MTDTQREAFEAAYAKQWSTVVGNEKTGADVAKLRTDDVGEPYGDRAYLNGCWWGYQAAQAADAGKEAVAWIRKTDITEWTDTEPETDGWTALFDNPPVAAINAELVEALEAITDQLERIGDTRRHKDGQYIEQARAALSRAKEQK